MVNAPPPGQAAALGLLSTIGWGSAAFTVAPVALEIHYREGRRQARLTQSTVGHVRNGPASVDVDPAILQKVPV
jgi:hypothetical protein